VHWEAQISHFISPSKWHKQGMPLDSVNVPFFSSV
jgi:hypothetical protein